MERTIPIEDNFEDVLNKAMVGLRIRKGDLCARTGISRKQLIALLNGDPDPESLLAVAPVLQLDGPSLVRLAEGTHRPTPVELDGIIAYNTPFPVPGYAEMTVNSYLLHDPSTCTAVAIDTGSDVGPMLRDLQERNLSLALILITHTHGDHVADLGRLLHATGRPDVWINERETLAGAKTFSEGKRFQVEALEIESRLTDGHSPGGTSYLVSGLACPVIFVGDALFCYSQGGAPGAYTRALANNREQILTLPDETLILPGHGPVTTVAEEKSHNPFYPELK